MKRLIISLLLFFTTICSYCQIENTPVNMGLDSIKSYTKSIGYTTVTQDTIMDNIYCYTAFMSDDKIVKILSFTKGKKDYLTMWYTFIDGVDNIKPINVKGFKSGCYKYWYIITNGNYKAVQKSIEENCTNDVLSQNNYIAHKKQKEREELERKIEKWKAELEELKFNKRLEEYNALLKELKEGKYGAYDVHEYTSEDEYGIHKIIDYNIGNIHYTLQFRNYELIDKSSYE